MKGNPRFSAPIRSALLFSGLLVLSDCTTTKPADEIEKPPLEFPDPTPSRQVKPGESFGHEPTGTTEIDQEWKSAVRVRMSVAQWGFEKKLMTERDVELEKADLESFLKILPNVELQTKPTVITFPGRVATIQSGAQIPTSGNDPAAPDQPVEMIFTGFMASVLISTSSGVDPLTPVSQASRKKIPIHLLMAFNEEEDVSEIEKGATPIVNQYRLDRKLNLNPGVETEVGRLTWEATHYVIDKIPVLADLPLIGRLPLFRPEVVLETRNTTIVTITADWVDPKTGE